MDRLLASLLLASFCWPEAACADELIRQANSQESLTLGVTYLHERFQSIDTAGTLVPNELSGPQIEVGYANTRMRTLFGHPDFYTRTEVSFGLSQVDFHGDSRDPETGAARKSDGPFNAESESMQVRLGYMREFGATRRFALTPFVGLAQHAALRGSSGLAGTGVYADFTAQVGLLGQVALTPQIVFGADASTGHTIGAWEVERQDVLGPTAVPSSFQLYLDNRTFPDWHQRLIVKYSDLRFGGVEGSKGGTLQPQRHSGLSIQLEFGTEGDLFELFFR
jgi:hypothetical protein